MKEVGEKFGISLQPPDISHIRPAGARRKKVSRRRTVSRRKGASGVKVQAQPTGKSQRSRAKVKTQPTRKTQGSSGAISATYKATGTPEEVAHFFRSLAQ
jgi:hypothetical protein